jgi:hypothetical protein
MGFKSLTADKGKKNWEWGSHWAVKLKHHPRHEVAERLVVIIHNSFATLAAAQREIIAGLNDLLERVDRIEAKLGIPH